MRNLALALVAALSLSTLGLTGCGGRGDNTVVEQTDDRAGSTVEEVNAYEQAMKQQGAQSRGN